MRTGKPAGGTRRERGASSRRDWRGDLYRGFPNRQSAIGDRKWAANAAISLIRCYQRFLSPILPARCKFEPTCSAYGIEAIRKKGFVRGVLLTAWRILRCNPWGRGGYDPVDPPDGGKESAESEKRTG